VDEKEKYKDFLIIGLLILAVGFLPIAILLIVLSTLLPNIDNFRLIFFTFVTVSVTGLFIALICIALTLAYSSNNNESENKGKD
jgi:ABC-type antimicrobial peptide transport system permease subunit